MGRNYTALPGVTTIADADVIAKETATTAEKIPFLNFKTYFNLTPLTGLNTGAGGTITEVDTPLSAFGKVENRLALNDAKVTGADRVLKAGDTMSGLLQFSGATHGGIKLNSLTTAERDLITPQNGMVIYNTTVPEFQGRVGGAWVTFGGSDATKLPLAGGTMSGPITLINGTVSAPSITWRNANTGIYSPVAGEISFASNGNERLRFVSGGIDVGTSYISFGLFFNSPDVWVTRFAANELQFGLGNNPITLHAGGTPSGPNVPAGDFTIQAGVSTGVGTPGAIVFKVSENIAASTTPNNVNTIFRLENGKIGFFGVTPVARSTGWSVSNVVTDKTYNATSTTLNEVAHTLGTLIEYLKTIGILGA